MNHEAISREALSCEEFLRLAAEGYNRIPLSFETPGRLRHAAVDLPETGGTPNSYLLESVQGGGVGAVSPSSACRREQCCGLRP